MKKYTIVMLAVVASSVSSASLFAFSSMSGLSTSVVGGAWPTQYSFSLNISIPYDTTLRPVLSLPTTPVLVPTADFDATQIPVHELPPLPLTLDEQE